MPAYAFTNPLKPGKTEDWKKCVAEMMGPRREELAVSRKKVGLTTEKVWLQSTPMGDMAVVYWEAPDIGKVFQHFLTSTEPFDVWFREKVLVDVHGMDPSAPPPPVNDLILDG